MFLQVTKRLLREVMEQDFFVEAGFVASGDVWKRKEVKVNTKLFYAQNKYVPCTFVLELFTFDRYPRCLT